MNSTLEIISVTAEKGWGMQFKANVGGKPTDFCIHGNTLGHCFPHEPGTTFIKIFEQNLPVILHAAHLLASTGRLDPRPQLGGTEILKENIHAAKRAQPGAPAEVREKPRTPLS